MSNNSLFFDIPLILLFTIIGKAFLICVGWLEWLLIYDVVALGFLYGSYISFVRSNVISRKFVLFKPGSIVILKPMSLIARVSFY